MLVRPFLLQALSRWCGALVPAAALYGAVVLAAPMGLAQVQPLERPAPGLVESGAPPFVVRVAESMGLDATPNELKRLPDGRMLAVSPGFVAIGDGGRWSVFSGPGGAERVDLTSVAIDQDGAIYAGTAQGFARLEFDRRGQWRLRPVAALPADLAAAGSGSLRVAVVGEVWLWSVGSGPIVRWRPGEEARVVGHANAIEAFFDIGGMVHYSDGSHGGLYRLDDDGFQPVPRTAESFVQDAITETVPSGEGAWLAGTIGRGVVRIDATGATRPLAERGILAGEHRINDLCATEGGYFAAAVDNVGVVFFQRDGRIVQVLDRSTDHRLARVRALLGTPGGVIWALLSEGIARIRFPARVSNYEPLVPTGLAFAQPFRLEGRLWLMSDGRAQRGIYDEEGRLLRFEVDSPPGYVGSMVELDGAWVAATPEGLWLWQGPQEWTAIAEGVNSASIRPEPTAPGTWLYVAENEVGWLRRAGDTWSLERHAVEGLGHVYGAVADAAGTFWAELGVGRVARVEPVSPRPYVEVYGTDDGLSPGWVQLFVIDGQVRVSTQRAVLRFDADARRWRPDTELMREMPGLEGVVGRPVVDARGMLWAPVEGATRVGPRGAMGEPDPSIPPHVRPIHITPQADGVVWLHRPMQLARYDPAIAEPASVPVRAVVARVDFAESGRMIVGPGAELPELAATDNSMTFDLLALDSVPGRPVSFTTKLEGRGDSEWVPVGSAGHVVLSRLDPGNYRLRVRPVVGDVPGGETALAFSIRVPWFRTPTAYVAYTSAGLAIIGLIGWLPAFLERREKARLERIVAARTAALNRANVELARQVDETLAQTAALRRSEDRYRRLTENAPDIIFRLRLVPELGFEYISRAVLQITGHEPEEFYRDPALMSRIAPAEHGQSMLELAAAGRLPEQAREIHGLARSGRAIVLEERLVPVYDDDRRLVAIEGILRDVTHEREEEARRRRLETELFQAQKLESMGTLAGGIAHDFNNILTGILGCCELASLAARDGQPVAADLEEIRAAGLRAKDLVARLLTLSRRAEPRLASMDLAETVDEALKLLRASTPATIEIIPALQPGKVRADATQIHQVVVNLGTNAVHAMRGGSGRLEVRVEPVEIKGELARSIPELPPGWAMRLTVADTGHGMDAATLARIFDPFFTTKGPGEGTGLGLSIVRGIIDNHGGALRVHTEVARGTRVEVYLPRTDTASDGAPVEPPALSVSGGQREILVVDDEPAVARFIAARLRQLGFRTQVFLEPLRAREAFVREPARFAAVITDLTMPRISGAELIRSIRAARDDIPVVVVSGFNVELSSLAQGALPRVNVLMKPFDGDELARALAAVLDGVDDTPG